MTDHDDMRAFVRTFCEALSSRDATRLIPLLAENVQWTIFGPIDYFPFFGHRKGRDAVVEAMCTQIAEHLRIINCSHERMLVDGDKAAVLMRMTAEHIPSSRVIAFRVAQFITFEEGRLVEMRAILDSFDIVEQVIDATQHRASQIAFG